MIFSLVLASIWVALVILAIVMRHEDKKRAKEFNCKIATIERRTNQLLYESGHLSTTAHETLTYSIATSASQTAPIKLGLLAPQEGDVALAESRDALIRGIAEGVDKEIMGEVPENEP